jgi:pimeloyl-ACP methyl ester carboxylesterase
MPSALFIHGAFSNPAHFASWHERFTAAGYRCHAPALPGHGAGAPSMLAAVTLADYLAALRKVLEDLDEPPVIIGHSMGGLLAQQLAASAPCRALVLVASAPPWMLTAQLRALPHLVPMMPAILAGRPLLPASETLRQLVLHDLPAAEQTDLLPTFGGESGRAYRAMILGLARLPAKPFDGPSLCLSGNLDRIIARGMSAAIARRHRAEHVAFDRGHWLIAPSAADEVAGRALRWLGGALAKG